MRNGQRDNQPVPEHTLDYFLEVRLQPLKEELGQAPQQANEDYAPDCQGDHNQQIFKQRILQLVSKHPIEKRELRFPNLNDRLDVERVELDDVDELSHDHVSDGWQLRVAHLEVDYHLGSEEEVNHFLEGSF